MAQMRREDDDMIEPSKAARSGYRGVSLPKKLEDDGEHDQDLNLNLNLSLKLAQQREEREEGEGEGGDSVADGAGSSRSSYRSTSSIREIDLVSSDAIYDLRSIAERMIAAGYLWECIQVYGSVRKSEVDASFRRLGIEKLSIDDVQRLEWDQLEAKIRRWIRAAKVCVRVLFASEKKLCEQIFENLGTDIDDACFVETVKGPAIQLFNLFEAISISRRSSKKLFKILDLHDALMVLIPDIDIVFEAKTASSTGTRYGSDPTTPDMEFADELEGKTPLALHLIWVIVILQFNLEGKSKHYKDTSLAHLFMMNNVHYIVQKVKGSPELREMIGDDLCFVLKEVLKQ
ncbi:hypothetical protein SO802_005057 [Lithocarpus litseifolius]|uniref:Exocyst subunit Exo70 family protein n=1 Tax=Lithocarpus litseifolius TaxID=425828 RepID=A0AAW2DIK6_9ROSI